MDFSGNLSSVVFRKAVHPFQGKIALDYRMLTLFLAFDGKKDLQSVAVSLGISSAEIREALLRLDALNLIQADPSTIPTLGADFFACLTDELSLALGPMAEILIDDEISDRGLEKERVPTGRAAELVGALAGEIPRQEKRDAFRRRMLKIIKSI